MNLEILNILKEAHKKNVRIGIEDGALTIKAVTSIDSSLLEKIKENKIAIIDAKATR